MTTAALRQQPTPERFFNAINAYELTEAIKTAVELEIFTAIAEGNRTAAMIAKRSKVAERVARILCDFLTIHGFLTKEGVNYVPAPDSSLFLDRYSEAYVGTAIEFLLTPRLRECHGQRVSRAGNRHQSPRRCLSATLGGIREVSCRSVRHPRPEFRRNRWRTKR